MNFLISLLLRSENLIQYKQVVWFLWERWEVHAYLKPISSQENIMHCVICNFVLHRYISILHEEGLHISQPGLDPDKSEVHHRITEREKGSKVHRYLSVKFFWNFHEGQQSFSNSWYNPSSDLSLIMLTEEYTKEAFRERYVILTVQILPALGKVYDAHLVVCFERILVS